MFQLLRKRKQGCWVQGTYAGIVGYADDNFLMAPSLDALQKMLDTCNEYAIKHDLKFSTNPIPAKSKTKCLAFERNNTEPPKLKLGTDLLPWVDKGKHLGNTLENIVNGMKKDMSIKRAQYINKNNEICQEFYFALPETKFHINKIYNSHFTGSPLWDLFCREAKMIENSWNVSFRIMFNLPRTTHRYFVEPISKMTHIKFIIMKNFLNFLKQIENGSKTIAKVLLNTVKNDVGSTTGSNIRKIVQLMNKESLNQIDISDIKENTFAEIPVGCEWRISVLEELLSVRNGKSEMENFTKKDIDNMIDLICTT